jgi:hypothetical protein
MEKMKAEKIKRGMKSPKKKTAEKNKKAKKKKKRKHTNGSGVGDFLGQTRL